MPETHPPGDFGDFVAATVAGRYTRGKKNFVCFVPRKHQRYFFSRENMVKKKAWCFRGKKKMAPPPENVARNAACTLASFSDTKVHTQQRSTRWHEATPVYHSALYL